MSTLIRPALARDIESICLLLHNKMNARIPVERWRQLMTYSWLADKPDFGRVVESDGNILGYCGQVYADRMIGSTESGFRQERIVSMSSWYLDKSMRGKGLGKAMLASAIDDSTVTYTTLTNSRKPLGIVQSLGFRVLEDHRYLWRKKGSADAAIEVTRNINVFRSRLDAWQCRVVDDMSAMPVEPILMEANGDQALLFFSIKRKGENVLWYDLLHASDLDLFADHAQALTDNLLPDAPSVLAVDGRFLSKEPEGATRESLPVPRFFISNRVETHEIDHLYSELQLLDLKLD